MNRRSLIKSLAGVVAMVAALPKGVSASRRNTSTSNDHQCDGYCFDAAENIARANIKETGAWKLQIHDWSKRTMVVTRCGAAACEVRLESPSHHPYWEYHRRSLTPEEKVSFHAEYGRSHGLLLSFGWSERAPNIRGFILNGRHNGWTVSVGPSV